MAPERHQGFKAEAACPVSPSGTVRTWDFNCRRFKQHGGPFALHGGRGVLNQNLAPAYHFFPSKLLHCFFNRQFSGKCPSPPHQPLCSRTSTRVLAVLSPEAGTRGYTWSIPVFSVLHRLQIFPEKKDSMTI